MTARLPTHIEIGGLIRAAEEKGGSGMVLSSGERDAGTVLILTMTRGKNAALWERMPQLDGSRSFTRVREEDPEKPDEISEYLGRRRSQDPDIWVLEIDCDGAEELVKSVVN